MTLIIAEAGVNHNGDMALARRLIDAAADAGADLIKFQTFRADRIATSAAVKAAYQRQSPTDGETQHAMLRRLELTRDMHEALIAHCKNRGIKFFSSGFDPQSVELLAELGADRFKIPSGEITNLPYLRLVGGYGKPIILSSGMATLREIEWALKVLESAGTPRERITVLHCNTDYPTPMADVNLRAMRTIAEAFSVVCRIFRPHPRHRGRDCGGGARGLRDRKALYARSDAAGAGPQGEPGASRVSKQWSSPFATSSRRWAMGSSDRAQARRRTFRSPANRSWPRSPIRAGEIFSIVNLAVKRPGTGLSPTRWDEVIGRRAPRDFAADELIEL